jgi:hypothetical protein
LRDWSPPSSPITLETFDRVNELRSQQRFTEAIVTIRECINGDDAPAGLHAELCRLSLLTGNLLDAVEECMAEEEVSASEQPVLDAALQAFASEAVRYTGGWGATLDTPVRITGAATDHIHVNAVHKYLEFVLGRRGRDWKLDRACLITHGDQLLDVMCVNLNTGEQVTIFFAGNDDSLMPTLPADQVLGCFITGRTARGEPARVSGGGHAELSTSLQFNSAIELPRFVMERLMTHSSQTLVLAGDEMY